MRASAADQAKLLAVQVLDSQLLRLAHQRKTAPEVPAVVAIEQQLAEMQIRLVAIQTEISDTQESLEKAEGDVAQVVARESRDQSRMDSGALVAKELESMQHELATLARRRAELEEAELEIMQSLEDAQATEGQYLAEQAQLLTELSNATAARDAVFAELDRQVQAAQAQRAAIAATVANDLLDLYDRIRADQGGVGAAGISKDKCLGCNIVLTDIAHIRAAAEDEVIRCEECRRILVRTGAGQS